MPWCDTFHLHSPQNLLIAILVIFQWIVQPHCHIWFFPENVLWPVTIKNKRPLDFRGLLPFHLCCLKALRNLPPPSVFSLIKIITTVNRNMSFLCLFCLVRKWAVVNNYQMYQMFYLLPGVLYVLWCLSAHRVQLLSSTGFPKKTKPLAWASLGFDLSDPHQLSLNQIVTYAEQRQPVHPCQAELHSPQSLLCVLSAQLSPPSKLIQSSGCSQEGCFAAEMKKIFLRSSVMPSEWWTGHCSPWPLCCKDGDEGERLAGGEMC